ncbi:hypothetical protein BHM03_00040204 [Ensete ventricosum]|nr:hypothetical protein BHM03_00040204 [Ensete ventricosum]
MGVFKPIEPLNSISLEVYGSNLHPCSVGGSVEPKIALRTRDPSDRVSFFPSWEVNLHVSGMRILEKGVAGWKVNRFGWDWERRRRREEDRKERKKGAAAVAVVDAAGKEEEEGKKRRREKEGEEGVAAMAEAVVATARREEEEEKRKEREEEEEDATSVAAPLFPA